MPNSGIARYQMILAYDGAQFRGFQRQGKARTVQAVVEAALRQLGWTGRTILSAGRTDTGVHASGQVIACDLAWTHSPQELARALNAHLPEDVAVRSVRVADVAFHPRYDAVSRTYHYHLFSEPERTPLRERYAWRVWPPLNADILPVAASTLVGTHDFAAFGAPQKPGGPTVRQVFRAEWLEEAGGLRFEICANAFLYHMVRRLVYLQVQAAQQRITIEELVAGVQTASPQMPGLAPPHGLTLVEVAYAAGE